MPVDAPLLKSEEWLRLAKEGSPMGLWYWNEDTGRVFWDAKACEMFGVDPAGEKSLATFYRCLHPGDRERVREVWRYQLEHRLPYDLEYRAVWRDGTIRFIHALGSGYYDKADKPLRMIGVVFDVTERRKADRERLDFGGRLLNAHEEERRHLARELHDDFSQRIALLSVDLAGVAGLIEHSAPDAHARLQSLLDSAMAISSDVHSLSHRLHSTTLELLGLRSSSEALCKQFSKQHAIAVRFVTADLPPTLPADAALCLFRVLQETLRNVGQHSGASQVEVTLTGRPNAISLTVSDNGAGFDADNLESKGIGIQSMRERVRMLSGTFRYSPDRCREPRFPSLFPCRSSEERIADVR